MHSSRDLLGDLRRLQCALLAVSEELDRIERRPHYSLRFAGQALSAENKGIEQSFANFAFAVRAELKTRNSERDHGLRWRPEPPFA
jgi:hypothetical protein